VHDSLDGNAGESVEREPLHVAPAAELTKLGPIWWTVDMLMLVGITVMLLSVGAQVVSRLVSASLPWTEELTRFLFMDMTFLGMAAGFRVAAHPRVTFLIAWGPSWLKKVSVHIYVVTGVVLFAVISVKSIELMLQQIGTGESSPALHLGMYLVTLPLVLSAVLSIVAHIQSVYFSADMRKTIEQGDMVA
jgi:TRAP-type C4-dicarboxylate transport system permease small subunit